MTPVIEKQQQQPLFGIRDVLTLLFKHKIKLASSFVIVVLVTIYIAMTIPSFYVARTVIMIKPGRENLPMGDVAPDVRLPMVSQESLTSNEMQLITSNDLIGDVVNRAGIYTLYPDLKQSKTKKGPPIETAIFRFKEDLLTNPVKGSNAIEILVRNKSPYAAAKAANLVVECLKDKHIRVYGTPKSTFITDQLKMSGEKVAEAQNKLAEFKKEKGVSQMKDQIWHLIGKKLDVETNLRIEESRLKELQDKVNFLKNQTRKVVVNLYTDTTRTKLTELKRRETELLSTYKDNSRPVTNIRKEIKTVQDALTKYEEEHKQSGEWVALEAELGPQQIKIDSVRAQLESVNKQLRDLSEAEKEYQNMERQLDARQKTYEVYVKKYEEMLISEDLDRRKVTNLDVIESASVPQRPEKKDQRKVIGMGFFLAISISIAWACLTEYLAQCMTTPQAAQHYLRLPVVLIISNKT
jgi:uncharacterized protein involved in exopolysaccharide biosynthesis